MLLFVGVFIVGITKSQSSTLQALSDKVDDLEKKAEASSRGCSVYFVELPFIVSDRPLWFLHRRLFPDDWRLGRSYRHSLLGHCYHDSGQFIECPVYTEIEGYVEPTEFTSDEIETVSSMFIDWRFPVNPLTDEQYQSSDTPSFLTERRVGLVDEIEVRERYFQYPNHFAWGRGSGTEPFCYPLGRFDCNITII